MSETRWPSGFIGDREVSNVAGREISHVKLWHFTKYTERFGLGLADTPTTQHVELFPADKDGELGPDIFAKCNVTGGGAADIDIDIKRNGITILTAPINILGADDDREQKMGTFITGGKSYVVGDVISADVSGTYTGAEGLSVGYSRIEQGD
jgi:hypothetical protein